MTSLSCPRVCDVILNEFAGLVVFDGVMMTAHARSESTHVASNLARLQLLARDVITKIWALPRSDPVYYGVSSNWFPSNTQNSKLTTGGNKGIKRWKNIANCCVFCYNLLGFNRNNRTLWCRGENVIGKRRYFVEILRWKLISGMSSCKASEMRCYVVSYWIAIKR